MADILDRINTSAPQPQDMLTRLNEEPSSFAQRLAERYRSGLIETIGAGMGLATGAAKGLYSSATHSGAGQLAQRFLPPEERAKIEQRTTARTTPEKVGKFAEQAAEFIVPEAAGLRLAKAPGAANLALRTTTEAAKAAGVSGVQSGGDPRQMGKAAAAGATFPLLGAMAGRGLQLATKILGMTTGAGEEAIRTAATNASQDFFDVMRGRKDEVGIVKDVRDAVADLVNERRAVYQRDLANLPQKNFPNLVPKVQQDVIDSLRNNYRVKVFRRPVTLPNGKKVPGPITLDFSGSPVTNPADQGKIRLMFNDLVKWRDDSTMGLDALKRRIDSYYGEDRQGRALIQSAKDQVRNALNKGVPRYQQMTQKYAEASDFLEQIEKEFNIHGHDGTLIRKIFPYALNQNNNYRKLLVEALDRSARSHVKEQLAGGALREWVPRGLVGRLAGYGGLLEAFQGPPTAEHLIKSTAGLLATSPRFVGETMALISQLRKQPLVRGAADIVAPVARGAAIESTQ